MVGQHFEVSGRPYYYIGTNLWYGAYLGNDQVPGGRARLVRELDALQRLGVNNLRVLGASEASDFGNYFPFTFQSSPGVYHEALAAGLDFLLAEMAKRKMHAVIYLNNFWNWSGGMGQYLTWFDPAAAAAIPLDPDRRWEREMQLSTLFYQRPDAQACYRQYIANLLQRRNTITGVIYRDDPTIMAWQLANEPRPGMDGPHGEANIGTYIRWMKETAAYIKSLDPHHLVSTGSEGQFGSIQNLDYYRQAHDSPDIDYLTVHIWAKNWGWFKADDATHTYSVAEQKALEHYDRHLAVAAAMHKPLVLEEFGIDRDNGSTLPGTPTRYRDQYYAKFFERLYAAAQAGAPAAGANFWAWGGEGNPMREMTIPREATQYTGDPFVEPQGLNAVFSQDRSTLRIIRHYARKMQALPAPAQKP